MKLLLTVALVCLLYPQQSWTVPNPADRKLNLEQRQARLGEVKKDMTANDVQDLLGKPDRVSRQILFRRHLEQWSFDDLGIRIEFNCLPGEEPRVLKPPVARP